jgi:DNA-binding NtrC family response regulator
VTETLLVIDDNEAVGTALEILFAMEGMRVLTATGPDEGLAVLDDQAVDLVIQDMNFTADTTSGEEGRALFEAIRDRDPDLPVILFTAWTDLETAVALVKAGAADYMAKPWDDERLVTTARNLLALRENALERHRLEEARNASRRRLADRYDLCGIVYESDTMQELLATACQVAGADVPVLITGPNGAGKEKVAEIIQANSAVAEGPFVRVNMGALPADLVESELFGADAGAFTGVARARPGRFEVADSGTLFLDEIGNLPLASQAKLLRVLQTGEFERLGSSQTRRASVRIISATNADLAAAVADGRFREDLYYRLNVIELAVPALAERMDDVLPLARYFAGPDRTLRADAERALLAHDWPGNVRELANRIQRACVLSADTEIGADSLGLERASTSPPKHVVPTARAEAGREAIVEALHRHGGTVARAARDLGLSRQALYRRMDKYGIPRDPV